MSPAAIPYIILLGFLFGTTLVASRFSVGQYHASNYVAIRLAMASLGYMLVYILRRDLVFPRSRRLWAQGIFTGVIGTAVPMLGIVSATIYLSSGLTAVLITAGPAITVILAHFSLEDERLDRRKATGVGLALSGAILLALLGESGLPDVSQADPRGYALIVIAMLSGAVSDIYIRRNMTGHQALAVATLRTIFAALAVGIAVFAFFGLDLSGVDQVGYFALGYAALCGTFLATWLMTFIIQRFGATAGSMSSYTTLAAAAITGALLLGEQITPGMMLGMALIVAGIALLNYRTAKADDILPPSGGQV